MNNRDRNNRKSGISDSNRHNNKYQTNKWKNNWGRNFNNYGNSNYRNTDYGTGHSDNRYNNWNQALPNPWDTDWFNNQQNSNFANNPFVANNFNVTTGIGVNFPRPNRLKNLKDKQPERTGDRNFSPRSQSELNANNPVDKVQKKIVKFNKDTPPSTVTSSSSTSQACSSNSTEKVAVVTDVATPSKQNEHNAEQVTRKLIHQLTSMNKHNLKQMINNPSSKYETALQTHARNRMRAEMRSKLQNMSSSQENQLVNNVLDTEESVDMDKIPDNVFDEIGRVLDINLLGQEDDSNKKYNENDSDDKDKEQIAYPEDLFLRAEKLLMENSILFLEDRLNDSMLNNDRLDEDRTPIKIKNEIKEEPDEIGDDNFFEIQESGNDNFMLGDLVFEDRDGSMSLRNDNFTNQLDEVPVSTSENHQNEENRVEMVRIPTTALIVKEEISDSDRYKEATNNNVKDISSNSSTRSTTQQSPKMYKSPEKQRPSQSSTTSKNNHKTITSDDFRTLLANVKQEPNRDAETVNTYTHKTNLVAVRAASPEPPKKIDLFTKLQNSGAFESTSVKRRTETTVERDYSRKKKKKHKSRSRSRLRSVSRSPSRSRNSRRSKKSSRDRSRQRDNSQYSTISDGVDDQRSMNKVANIEYSNDSSIHQLDQNDESRNNKFVEDDEPAEEDRVEKTELSSNQTFEVACADELITKTLETQPDKEATNCDDEEVITTADNQHEAQTIPDPTPTILNEGIDNNTDSNSNNEKDVKDMNTEVETHSISNVRTLTLTDKNIDAQTVLETVEGKVQETSKEKLDVDTKLAERNMETLSESTEDIVSEKVKDIVPDLVKETVPDLVKDTVPEVVKDTVPEVVKDTVPEVVKDTVPEVVKDTVPEVVKDTVPQVMKDIVPEVVKETSSTETVRETEIATLTETATEKVKEPVKTESGGAENDTDIIITDAETSNDVKNEKNKQLEVASETIEEESVSISSNSVEVPGSLNSESQSSTGEDTVGVVVPSPKTDQSQKNNIVAIRKIVLKPSTTLSSSSSSSSRHQKSSSKHKCEKERHSSSNHKGKKSETNSKKSDQKDNSTGSGKHSHSDQPNRAWRSAGEKKCIETSSKSSTLRSINIFDPSRPIEPIKVADPIKVAEPVKVGEPKSSSSPRKDGGKSQSRTMNKTPAVAAPQHRIESKKSSVPVKKSTTLAIKEKVSPVHHRHQQNADSKMITDPTTISLLSDSLKSLTDSGAVLQRMKDIDLKIMAMQMKKTTIDEQINNLHREKSVIDQTTIQLQNERFVLLSSLLTGSVASQKKMFELTQEKCVDQKVVEVSSDDEVLVAGTRRISSKTKSNAVHNSKRKCDDDAMADGVDGTKCKKLKVNLNPLKPQTNNKNNVKNSVDVDQVQSDLKSQIMKETRRCTVRLTKLSSKKIKLLIGRPDIGSNNGSDGGYSSRLKNNVTDSHKAIFDGHFCGHRLPIVHLQVIDGFLIAASEDSNLYMHDLVTGKLLETFTAHTKTVTNFIATERNNVYSVSLDGYLKKISLKKFDEQLLSVNVGEALQVMDFSWDTAFIGSRSGKIYIFDTKTDTIAEECLCSVGKSIMALKATKEGPRKILIASSRCHNISVRDAISGLLLRTIEVPDKLTIYSILLDGGQLYCGTNKNLVFRYEFTSGAEISRIKLGTGTICLKSYKNSLILGGCYDGFIYAYDTKNEVQLSRFPGPGKMLLHFDVYKDNIIAAAKDKSLCVLEVPDDIVSHENK